MPDAESLQSSVPWDLDSLVLGLASYVFAGLFLLSSIGRGRLDHRLQVVFDTAPQSLGALRDALHAKARGQAGTVYFVLGTILLALGFLDPGPPDWTLQIVGAGAMLVVGVLFLLLLDRYVAATLRRRIRFHLRQHPFAFEENLSLTRDIGDLFRIPTSQEDTLESYVAKVRAALGIHEPPPKLFGRRTKRW